MAIMLIRSMTRKEIITQLEPFFTIDELVCNHTLARFGDGSWRFLDTNALHLLLVLRRDIFKRPIWINNHKRGVYQRGLRCNMCQLVREKTSVYLTAHGFGKGWDMTIEGLTAEEARNIIMENTHRLPCKVRMERNVTWLHIDTLIPDNQTEIISFFNA